MREGAFIIPKSRAMLNKIDRLRKPGSMVEHFALRAQLNIPTHQKPRGIELFIQRFRNKKLATDELERVRGEVGLENAQRVKAALDRLRPRFDEAGRMVSQVTEELKSDTTLDFARRNDEKYIEENIFDLKIVDKRLISWEMYSSEALLWPKGFNAHVYAVAILAVVSDRLITPLDTEAWTDDARVVLGVYGGFGTDLSLKQTGFKFRLIDPVDPMTVAPSKLAEALAGAMAISEDALAACVRYATGQILGGDHPPFVDDHGFHPIIKHAQDASKGTYQAVRAFLDNPSA